MYCCGTLLPLSLLDKFERMSMKDLKNLVKSKVAPVIVAPGKVSGLLLLFFFVHSLIRHSPRTLAWAQRDSNPA